MLDWFVALARLAVVPVIFGVCAAFSAVGLVPCWYLYHAIEAAQGTFVAFLSIPFLYFVWGITYCACAVVLKLVLFYHPKPGSHGLVSWHTVGWGLTGATTNFANIMFLVHFKGTPLLNLWYRALGVKMGKNVAINSVQIFDWNLLTIEDDVVIGGDAVVMAHSVEGAKMQMQMQKVRLGKGAIVGGNSKVMPGCELGEKAVLGASSLMTKGTIVGDNQMWGGIPARFLRDRGVRPDSSPVVGADAEKATAAPSST